MESDDSPKSEKTPSPRYKCSACYKQYKKAEHLVEHLKLALHSAHDPRCGVCRKHCKSLESLREHLAGPKAKEHCMEIFSDQGCDLCLKLFDNPASLSQHREWCLLSAPAPIETMIIPNAESQSFMNLCGENDFNNHPEAIAVDCEMVGGGSDGSLDLCARVCLTDENENVLFNTYVRPQLSITNYRYEITGLEEGHFRNAMPLIEVQDKVLEILYNEESIGRSRLDGGKAKLLVGHDLDCMGMYYPEHLLRDTAKYRPLMKTNRTSHSLTYLTKKYLGYDIQSAVHDPYEDCVAVMRLYKRFQALDHQTEGTVASLDGSFDSWTTEKFENMTAEELYALSKPDYKCWCLDTRQALQP
ncbi:uncharacterized protein LOC126782237 [Argentina anserina]|uniref:uncharacterized protein LOC126782237 n=1 Tax=Argentina anserina TaxID=57926 RepID=UPI0021766B2B|nr:uncharacterized protein LOC126782237 [Potentilla anserina]